MDRLFLKYLSEQYSFKINTVLAVLGGDINEAYQLQTDSGYFFIKFNHASKFPGMLASESKGLELLKQTHTFQVPNVIGQGVWLHLQYLILEWIPSGQPTNDFWINFGEQLATLHQHSNHSFGLDFDNYIGSLPQLNTPGRDFASFYAEKRINPLIKKLRDKEGINESELSVIEKLSYCFESLIPKEPPSLIHGDLWAGNYMINLHGAPVLIDPAPYYGHRELDIALTKLFGGFDSKMLDAYQQVWPLERGWESRVPLFQLYPLLVHAVLFGGHYIHSAINNAKTFI